MFKQYGLVLAGGGAKGAYQMGAWKAMREQHIHFSAVSGVSIGAINGALILSNNFKEALTLWNSVTLDKGVKIEGELKDPNNLFSVKNYTILLKEFLKKRGIDASPAKSFLSQFIDEDKVRSAEIPFGIITYQLSSMTPLELFLEDIPEGQLIDYLLASSKFPGVSNVGPEDNWYLDGGVYDNAPIKLLRKRGINHLIVVDISSIKGAAHENDFSCCDVVYIRPYNIDDLGASFDFSDDMTEIRMKMGYLDAKKAFGRLSGNIYYFSQATFKNLIQHYGAAAVEQLERLAYKLDLPRLKIYKEKEFLAELKKLYIEREEQAKQKEQEKDGFIENILKRFSAIKRNREDYEDALAVLDGIVV